MNSGILVKASAFLVNAICDHKSFFRAIKKIFIKNQLPILMVLLVILAYFITARAYADNAIRTNTKNIVIVPDTAIATDLSKEITADDTSNDIRKEAEYVAKVLYGTALDNSAKGKEFVIWCIINRVESEKYPNSVQEVCQQKDQWMGYSDKNPIMQDLYDIAYNELTDWHNGSYRKIGPDYVFLSWSPASITLRTEFEEGRNCKYLYE